MKKTPCPFCERKFDGQESLDRHARDKHRKAAKLVRVLRAAITPFAVAAEAYQINGSMAGEKDHEELTVYLQGVTVGDLRKLAEAYHG